MIDTKRAKPDRPFPIEGQACNVAVYLDSDPRHDLETGPGCSDTQRHYRRACRRQSGRPHRRLLALGFRQIEPGRARLVITVPPTMKTSAKSSIRFVLRRLSIEPPSRNSLMSPLVIMASPDDSLRRVARIMARRRIHRVILTNRGRIAGVVSSMDIVRAFARAEVEKGRRPGNSRKRRATPDSHS